MRLLFAMEEFAADVGAEFVSEFAGESPEEADGGAVQGESKAAVGFGIVSVGDGAAGEGSENVGPVELAMAAVSVGGELLGDGVEDPAGNGSSAEAEVARVLMKKDRVGSAGEASADDIQHGGAIAPAVSGGALTVLGEFVTGLAEASLDSSGEPHEGVECLAGGESEFLPDGERRRSLLIGDSECRDDEEEALVAFRDGDGCVGEGGARGG